MEKEKTWKCSVPPMPTFLHPLYDVNNIQGEHIYKFCVGSDIYKWNKYIIILPKFCPAIPITKYPDIHIQIFMKSVLTKYGNSLWLNTYKYCKWNMKF